MLHLHTVRSYLPIATIGTVEVKGQTFQSLELPWKDNKPNESCIPEGTYLVKRDRTGRHQWYAVQNVPNRTFIELHPANSTKELLGCQALGISRSKDNIGLWDSNKAMNMFLNLVGDDDFLMTYRAFNPNVDYFN